MTKTEKEPAQILLMQRIKEALPKNISLVDELADLLKISNDSAYRRMRGQTDLSVEKWQQSVNTSKYHLIIL